MVGAPPCVDRRAPATCPVHKSVGGKCRMNECRRHERRRHHPLSTAGRRPDSASQGPKARPVGQRAQRLAAELPKSTGRRGQISQKPNFRRQIAEFAESYINSHFSMGNQQVLANQILLILQILPNSAYSAFSAQNTHILLDLRIFCPIMGDYA